MNTMTHRSRRARGGKLVAKPIMIYPNDPDTRSELSLLAALDGEPLSRWMFTVAKQYLNERRGDFKNWNKMLGAFRNNELTGVRGMIGVPAPVLIEK